MAFENLCESGDPLNTGIPTTGNNPVDAGKEIFLFPIVADDGGRNQLVDTDIIDQAFFTALIENPDPSKRLYPLGRFKDVTDVRAAPGTQAFNDGSSVITVQGVRVYNGKLLDVAPVYLTKIRSLVRTFKDNLGIYTLNNCGEPVGTLCIDGGGVGVDAFRPIKINTGSVDTTIYDKNQPDVSKGVPLAFEYDQFEEDLNLRVLEKTELGGAILTGLNGLVDMLSTITSITTTGFNIKLTVNFDDTLKETVVGGGVIGDFTVFNETTNLAVTVTGAVEAPTGNYAIAYIAQTSADILKLTSLLGAATRSFFKIDKNIITP